MQWTFLLRSAYQPRMESRILQILDHHMVEMESFSSMRMAHDVWITLVLRAEQAQADRIHGLFGRLQNIKRLDMFSRKEAILRTSVVIKIWCALSLRHYREFLRGFPDGAHGDAIFRRPGS